MSARTDASGYTADPGSGELSVGLRRFKRYPEYRDSGVGWLGPVPAGWEVKRLKFSAELGPSASAASTLPVETEVSFVPMEAVGEYGGMDLSRTKRIADVRSGYTYFADGDIVLAKITPCFENGKGAIAERLVNGIAFGTTELHVLRARQQVDKRFLFYITLSHPFRRLGAAEMYGAGGQKRVPEAFVEGLMHPLPSRPEQHRIIAFLDRATARIDALVAKKERLIELLKEKRTATITRAVTEGLDSSGEVSATGSNVFPQIPAAWKLRKLRRLITRIARPVEVDPDGEYREIGIRSWGRGIFHKDAVRGALLEDKSVYSIEPGDFVLNIVFAWEGAVAVASEVERGMVGSHRFPTFRCADEVDLDYLLMVLQTEQGRAVMEVNSPGAAGRNKTIRLDQFLDEAIPLPSVEEQREIVRQFRSDERKLVALIDRLELAIQRLRELRTALISVAVTGKIDVRNEAA